MRCGRSCLHSSRRVLSPGRLGLVDCVSEELSGGVRPSAGPRDLRDRPAQGAAVRGGVVIVTAVLAVAWLGPPALRAEEKSVGLGAGVVTGEDQYGHPLWLTANVRISLGRGLVLEP